MLWFLLQSVLDLCVVITIIFYTGMETRRKRLQSRRRKLKKDFEKNYPKTPREVVKWYNRIITAFYGEEYTDDELEDMADQVRMLMDDELLSYNPRDTYIKNLKADIEDYKTRKKTIVQSSVSDSNDITYATVQGDYCAYVDAYYFSREASDYSRTYEEFVLRKDDDGHWKILTFRLMEGDYNE